MLYIYTYIYIYIYLYTFIYISLPRSLCAGAALVSTAKCGSHFFVVCDLISSLNACAAPMGKCDPQ